MSTTIMELKDNYAVILYRFRSKTFLKLNNNKQSGNRNVKYLLKF